MLHPNSLFQKYKGKIADLGVINKESIQTEQFLLYHDSKIQIYYAPHNEYINEKASVFIKIGRASCRERVSIDV